MLLGLGCSCRSTIILNKFRKISNYICIPSLVTINILLFILFNLLPSRVLYQKDLLQLQQQYCSCSSSDLFNQFKTSNYPVVPRELKKSFHPLLSSMYWLKNKQIIHLLCTYDMYRSIFGHPSLYIDDSLHTVEHGLAQHVEALCQIWYVDR